MDGSIYILAGLLLAVLGFLWTIHRDMRALSDRLTKDMNDLSGRLTKDIKVLSERTAKDHKELSTDLRGLSDRVARLEGLFEGAMRRRDQAAGVGD